MQLNDFVITLSYYSLHVLCMERKECITMGVAPSTASVLDQSNACLFGSIFPLGAGQRSHEKDNVGPAYRVPSSLLMLREALGGRKVTTFSPIPISNCLQQAQEDCDGRKKIRILPIPI